jgi:UDP-N-acetylmuramate: L-alanyl-gamma-D-glutamyl-meso-diaminopimelate ligase
MSARVHFIGICGTAMATLAAMLQQKGLVVTGSDQSVYPPMSEFLERERIQVFSGYNNEHITPDLDLVVVGNAISRGNPELEEVLDRKIRYCSLPEAIREHFLWGARSIVITGTHGKTTTTSLTGWVLAHGGVDPTVFVGGIARNFGDGGSSYRMGGGRDFVIEGDEYDSAFFDKTAKFLKYLPDIAVVNNIEFDHADIYADLEAVTLAFRRFVHLVPRQGLLLVGSDSPVAATLVPLAASRAQTFGTAAGCDWRALDLEITGATTRFHVRRSGSLLGTFEVPLLGAHNVRNALAAIAVGTEVGISQERIAEGLRTFAGVRRRLEVVGTADGVTVYDDFAHHPTAVAETLAALRAANPDRRIWAVFEPRSASSCRRVFQDEFAHAFEGADETLLAPVFRSSLPEGERLSLNELVRDLRKAGRSARAAASLEEIIEIITREHQTGDLVVLMSNGGFGGVHRKLLTSLGRGTESIAPGAAEQTDRA